VASVPRWLRSGCISPPSASKIAQAALTSPMWLKAWGKLPSSSPLVGSTSSASKPMSLTKAAARSKTVRARAG
jgi:hypothetical protein